MFEGFALERVTVSDATLRVRYGGAGPPLLLLHGHPRTHATWSRVAELLASDFTVICPDLRGFGESTIPADTPNHVGSSKRAKALDCLELMHHLGFERFAIGGHDRGSYTAFRLAMDHPSSVTRLTIMDGVPILEAVERCDARFAQRWWHWFFFAQPDKPERVIRADPDAWYSLVPEKMGAEEFEDVRRATHNPAVVHGMIEDYRAGLAVDHLHDAQDREAGRQLQCPTMVLWSQFDDLEVLYGDVLAVWKPWAGVLHGKGLPCRHHMAEEVPELVAAELLAFNHDVPPHQ